MDNILGGFTMVTDGAAVMARVANASVSREIQEPDETWMSCMADTLNSTMRTVLATQCETSTLQVVVNDFRSMKGIIEDANRTDWNHNLRSGCRLKQECETRFGTYYQVSKKFLKAAERAAQFAYSSSKKTSISMGPL